MRSLHSTLQQLGGIFAGDFCSRLLLRGLRSRSLVLARGLYGHSFVLARGLCGQQRNPSLAALLQAPLLRRPATTTCWPALRLDSFNNTTPRCRHGGRRRRFAHGVIRKPSRSESENRRRNDPLGFVPASHQEGQFSNCLLEATGLAPSPARAGDARWARPPGRRHRLRTHC